MRVRLEETMRRVDGWSPRLAIGVGLAGFFVVSLLLTRLPVWGFVAGCCLLSAAIVWLALSAKPVFKVIYPAAPSPTLVRPNPLPVASLPTVEPASAKALAEPLEMIELPGGEFWMGSPPQAPGRRDDEARHRVRVSAFEMARFPVTQRLYVELMGENPSHFRGTDLLAEFSGDAVPVDNVSWFDALRFCNRLSQRAGLRPCYRITEPPPERKLDDGREVQPEVEWDQNANGYRLPTEAEWEYACRAGTETAYSFGDDPARLGEHAWFDHNSWTQTHEVGMKKPNRWGLYDLHGNVWEWCWDWYGYGVYLEISAQDRSYRLVSPVGPQTGTGRVVRGGSFYNGPLFLRSANRNRHEPEDRYWNVGFRCVRGTRSAGVP